MHEPTHTPRNAASTPDAEIVARTPVFLVDRSLAAAVLASLLLHAALVITAYSVRVPEVRIDVSVKESRAVALMSQVGFAPSRDEPEKGEDEFVDVEEPPEPEPADVDEVPEDTTDATEDTADEPEVEAAPDDEPVPEVTPDTPVERIPDEIASAEAPVIVNPIPNVPAPSRPAPADAPPTDGSGSAEVDPADLPPSQRYPEGTVNPVATDVGMWGPEGAASVALIRADRIRDNVHRDDLERIFAGLGDYSDLSRNTSIDILDDVDVMLLASTDITRSSKTFIAAVHELDPTYLMSELRRGYPSGVNWEERDGRYWGTPGAASALPRRFLIPADRLLIYTPPEFLEPLLGDAPRPYGLSGDLDGVETRLEPPPDIDGVLVELGLPAERPQPYTTDGDPCADRRGIGRTRCRERQRERRDEAERAIAEWEARREELLPAAEEELERREDEWDDARSNDHHNRADREPPVRADQSWIEGLLEAGDLAGTGRDGPAVLWTFNGFDAFGLGGLRPSTAPPTALHTSLTLESDPILTARFLFRDRAQAEDFRSQWPAVVEFYTFPLTAAGLLRAFRNGTWEIDHSEAIVSIRVPAAAMGRLALAVGMMGGG